MFPQARREDVIVCEMADETLVYTKDSNRAHCLNRTAAFVWNLCNGRTSIGAMATALQKELGLPAEEGLVHLALEELEKGQLLEGSYVSPEDATGCSRRAVLAKLGVSLVALPLVMSVTAPDARAAASPFVLQGAPGIPGAPGAQGFQGARGPQGAQGAQGFQGMVR